MNWNDVIGQDDVKRRLVSMVHNNRLPHALMLCGPSGSGKLALGLALASYLLANAMQKATLLAANAPLVP